MVVFLYCNDIEKNRWHSCYRPVPTMCCRLDRGNLLFACRIFGKSEDEVKELTEFGEDRVFNDLRYTINNGKLQELGWTEVRGGSYFGCYVSLLY